MNRFALGSLLAASLGAAAVVVAHAEEEPAVIPWRTDLEAARAEAAEQGRPLMVVFR